MGEYGAAREDGLRETWATEVREVAVVVLSAARKEQPSVGRLRPGQDEFSHGSARSCRTLCGLPDRGLKTKE